MAQVIFLKDNVENGLPGREAFWGVLNDFRPYRR